MVLQVENSPFSEQQVKLLNELLPKLTDTQKNLVKWLFKCPASGRSTSNSRIRRGTTNRGATNDYGDVIICVTNRQ